MITGFKLLKLLSAVCEFGWQTYICKKLHTKHLQCINHQLLKEINDSPFMNHFFLGFLGSNTLIHK